MQEKNHQPLTPAIECKNFALAPRVVFVLAFVSLIDSLTSGKMPPVCKPPQTFVCNKIRAQHCLLGQHIRLATVRRSTSTQFGGASHSMGARGTGGGDDTSPAAKRAWSFPEAPCAGRKRRRTHFVNIWSISVGSEGCDQVGISKMYS